MGSRAVPIGVLVGFVLLIVVLAFGLTRDPSQLPSTYIDKSAPAFDLPSLIVPQNMFSTFAF